MLVVVGVFVVVVSERIALSWEANLHNQIGSGLNKDQDEHQNDSLKALMPFSENGERQPLFIFFKPYFFRKQINNNE